MSSTPYVQRNPYKGSAPRAWVRLRLAAPDGSLHERDLLADTGCPCALILGSTDFTLLAQSAAGAVTSNFGTLTGGWLELQMPELGLIRPILGYGSEPVARAARRNSNDFSGLVGLSFLRLTEYGGDADWFWLRPGVGVP